MTNKIVKADSTHAFDAAIEAITTLKQIEKEGRKALPEEKEILARFSGFGGLALKAFPNPATGAYAKGWKERGELLAELLTEEEYASAKRTTFTAFYTSGLVMQEMHRGLARMGIEGDAIGLEPGCGIGNFIAQAPADIKFIGVEQDSISGRIARLLYPEHDIRVEGFQDTNLVEGSVDFAIGNVPFAEIKLRFDGTRYALHDYFFLKSLEAVRPGGAVAFITSRYTMDKADGTVRRMIAKQADFAGAIRLPETAFRDQGTRVITDIIFLRKKLRGQEERPSWAKTSWRSTSDDSDLLPGMRINDYFLDNPHMVLGEMSVGQGMYNEASLRVRSDGELAAALHAAIDGLPEGICTARTSDTKRPLSVAEEAALPACAKEGSIFIADDTRIMQVVAGRPEVLRAGKSPLKADGTKAGKRLGSLVRLREQAREVLRTQQEGLPDEAREAARRRLKQAYTRFTQQYGPINKTTFSERKDGGITRRMPNLLRFRRDPDVFLVMALEIYDEQTGRARPAAIMEQDVITAPTRIDAVSSAKDGLLASLNQLGRVDLDYIAALYGRPEGDIVSELNGLIYFDPAHENYVTSDEYLSGDVRLKLKHARASDDPRTEGNVKALEAVQPQDLHAEEIDVTLGTPWIPAKDVTHFLAELLEIAPSSVKVSYLPKEALWKIRVSPSARASSVARSKYGTAKVDAFALAELAMNMRTPTVKVLIDDGERERLVVDEQETLAAREKQNEVKTLFSQFVFQDPTRRKRLVRLYNDTFNNIRLRTYDGQHLSFDGMAPHIKMREHQQDAVWRAMCSGNALFAHVVGAGKTFTMIASAMEMKRTGLARKPLFVVPNHMLEQFAREFLTLYPGANLLVATKEDFSRDRRKVFTARMATGEWDGVIMTHSSFEKIPMSPDFQAEFIRGEVAEYEKLLVTIDDDTIKNSVTKKVEKLKEKQRILLGEMAASERKDDGLYFEQTGADVLFVDEAHMFKNLQMPTKMDRVAGINTDGSKRSFDLFMKARYLHSRTPGRGLVCATGTPISNSVCEMYTMLRFLMPDQLEARGIGHFDAWAANFGEVINALEIAPDGAGLRVNTRFAKFKNLPELLSLFRLVADVQTASMLKLPVPKIKGGKPEIITSPMTDAQLDVQEGLVRRYEVIRGGRFDPKIDNALKIVTDGRKLALDARMVDGSAEDHPQSKLNRVVDNVFRIWERTREDRSTQMIFSDLGVRATSWGFCAYDEIVDKLIQKGIPREEIAVMGDATSDAKKEALFGSVRAGRVRVLLGSTTKMGTGTNAQTRLIALHNVDPPWRPADIEQREGRILRQGNRNQVVEILRYVTEGSFDAYMWQTLVTKARFIAQAMQGDAGTRRADDIGDAVLSFEEVKAIASGNPAMMVLAEMEVAYRRLSCLRSAHLRDQGDLAARQEYLPGQIERSRGFIEAMEMDIARRQETQGDAFVMTVGAQTFQKDGTKKRTARQRAEDALALAVARTSIEQSGARHSWSEKLGELGGFDVVLSGEVTSGRRYLTVELEGAKNYPVATIHNPTVCPALIPPLETTLRNLDKALATERGDLVRKERDLEDVEARSGKPFASEEEYTALRDLKNELSSILSGQHVDSERSVEILAAFRELEGDTLALTEEAENAAPEAAPVEALEISPAAEDSQPAHEVLAEGPAEAEIAEPPSTSGRQQSSQTGGRERPSEQMALFVQEAHSGLPQPAVEVESKPEPAENANAPKSAPEPARSPETFPQLLSDAQLYALGRTEIAPSVRDVVDPLQEYYSRPELLEDLVRTCMENAVPFVALVDALRSRGTLKSPGKETAQEIRHIYNAAVVTLHDIDVGAAIDARFGTQEENKPTTRANPRGNTHQGGHAQPRNEWPGARGARGHSHQSRRTAPQTGRAQSFLIQPGRSTMTIFTPYNVLEALEKKSGTFAESFDEASFMENATCVPADEATWFGDHDRSAASYIAEKMWNHFENPQKMEALLLESLKEFRPFDDFINDVRLKRTGQEFTAVEEGYVRAQYEGSLLARAGFRFQEGPEGALSISGTDRQATRQARAESFASRLSTFEVSTAAARAGEPVYPRDVVTVLDDVDYSRPDLAKHLVILSVEEMRPFGSMLRELRRFGELDNLDQAESNRLRLCYNCLVAAGLGIDMQAERATRDAPAPSRDSMPGYDVIKALTVKAHDWEASLSTDDLVAFEKEMATGARVGFADLAEVLAGRFRSDEAMLRVFVDGLDRLVPFERLLGNGTLGRINPDTKRVDLEPEVKARARVLYNTCIAQRVGLHVDDSGTLVAEASFEPGLRARANAWAENLPSAHLMDLVEDSGYAVYPKDLEGILADHFSQNRILKQLIKQSVEDMVPVGTMLENLAEVGELTTLDAKTTERVTRCYNALMAAGLGIDAQMVLDTRERQQAQTQEKSGHREPARGNPRSRHQHSDGERRKPVFGNYSRIAARNSQGEGAGTGANLPR